MVAKKPVKQEKLMFRVPNTKEGRHDLQRIKKSLNTNSYSMWTKFTGPRPKGTPQGSTLRENATSIRVYVDSKRKEDNINPYDYIQRGREIERNQQAYKNGKSLDAYKADSNDEEIATLQRANWILEVKLSLLLDGLKDSPKYGKFAEVVNNLDLSKLGAKTINSNQYKISEESMALANLLKHPEYTS